MREILEKIARLHAYELQFSAPLSGGDINAVYVMHCSEGKFVAKLNAAGEFPDMLKKEARGLQFLRETETFKIPEVIGTGTIENQDYLLLEYLNPVAPSSGFWKKFAEKLALLHQTTSAEFGLNHDNYIGSLVQYNGFKSTAAEFFITCRLEPQFKLAQTKGFNFENLDHFYKTVAELIPNEESSLVHGDLWNGNYLVSENDEPVLIDPAIAFAPREMDFAMMQLFGGFPAKAIDCYNEIYPLLPDWQKRIRLYQLYYVLVHLNIFGSSYLAQTSDIIRAYS